METIGRIHSFESFGTVDGPGIRFVVFMQGCALRCRYCHNPDTWDLSGGTPYTVAQVMAKIERYLPYFAASGGGVTISGGEPVLQLPFLRELLAACQAKGIHTALDTAGWIEPAALAPLLSCLDLILLDIKHIDADCHLALCGQSNRKVLRLARFLARQGFPFWVRHVVVPGYTDDTAHLARLGRFLGRLPSLQRLELLPYHRLGEHKWENLGLPYTLAGVAPPDAAKLAAVRRIILAQGMQAEIA